MKKNLRKMKKNYLWKVMPYLHQNLTGMLKK